MKIFNFIHTKNNSNKNYSDAMFLTHNIAKMQKLDSSTVDKFVGKKAFLHIAGRNVKVPSRLLMHLLFGLMDNFSVCFL